MVRGKKANNKQSVSDTKKEKERDTTLVELDLTGIKFSSLGAYAFGKESPFCNLPAVLSILFQYWMPSFVLPSLEKWAARPLFQTQDGIKPRAYNGDNIPRMEPFLVEKAPMRFGGDVVPTYIHGWTVGTQFDASGGWIKQVPDRVAEHLIACGVGNHLFRLGSDENERFRQISYTNLFLVATMRALGQASQDDRGYSVMSEKNLSRQSEQLWVQVLHRLDRKDFTRDIVYIPLPCVDTYEVVMSAPLCDLTKGNAVLISRHRAGFVCLNRRRTAPPSAIEGYTSTRVPSGLCRKTRHVNDLPLDS